VEGGGTPGYVEHRLLCTCNAESKITHQHPAHMHYSMISKVNNIYTPASEFASKYNARWLVLLYYYWNIMANTSKGQS